MAKGRYINFLNNNNNSYAVIEERCSGGRLCLVVGQRRSVQSSGVDRLTGMSEVTRMRYAWPAVRGRYVLAASLY